jgi:anti-anti-sigma factor
MITESCQFKGEKVQITKDESGQTLSIKGALDIGAAEVLRQTLHDFIGESSSPILELSEIEFCDTAAVQVLSSAQITAERLHKPLTFGALSPAVANTCAALGLRIGESN